MTRAHRRRQVALLALQCVWPRRLARDLALIVMLKLAVLAAIMLVWFSDPPPVSASKAQHAVFGELGKQR